MIVCLSVSYLQMIDCHNFTHFFAVSLKVLKSSREQGVLSSGHCSRCPIVCVSVPQLHEELPVWYPHLIKFALVRPTPDLSRLSVFHVGFAANSATTSSYKFSLYSNQCRAETGRNVIVKAIFKAGFFQSRR